MRIVHDIKTPVLVHADVRGSKATVIFSTADDGERIDIQGHPEHIAEAFEKAAANLRTAFVAEPQRC